MNQFVEKALAGLPPGLDIIDMHAHVGCFSYTVPDRSVGSIVASMDRLGIAAAAVAHIRCTNADAEYGNEIVCNAMQEYPGRILGYVGVFPYGRTEVRRNVERWLGEGFSGLKFHDMNGIPYNHPSYAHAHAIANERRIPMLFHTWGTEKQLDHVGRIASACPDAPVLLAHAGAEAEERYVDFMKKHPNAFLDVTYSRSPRGLVRRFADAVGAARMVWGSDVNVLNQAQQLGKVFGSGLPLEDMQMILAGNARRILEQAGAASSA
ncbi:MAG: amidohydrolase family protein [Planctomycetes bacterium]|nr:amidohydrolase family protein [Planctomycetota bacterium]